LFPIIKEMARKRKLAKKKKGGTKDLVEVSGPAMKKLPRIGVDRTFRGNESLKKAMLGKDPSITAKSGRVLYKDKGSCSVNSPKKEEGRGV